VTERESKIPISSCSEPPRGSVGPTAPVRPSFVVEALRRTESLRPLLLVLDGPRAGERLLLPEAPLVMGRSVDCHLHFADEGMSSRHLEIRPTGDGRFRIVDLGSRNGTLVNGVRVGEHVLIPGDRILAGRTPLRYVDQTVAEEDLLRHLEQAAIQDPLTLLHNRRYFDLRLAEEWAHSRRAGTVLGLLMLDIDHFKCVNDSYGHPVGDRLLVELGALLRGNLRGEDVLARVGGEEFAVLVRPPDVEGPRQTAERLRAAVAAMAFVEAGVRVPVTVSAGAVAVVAGGGLQPPALIEQVDRELYRAKESGRNRVCAVLCGRPPAEEP
jgi:two-component system, cell cycle response regulator